ncbi:MAG TPA: ATP-binding cassette domain-containing protein [Burkholderiales bacterium]|jgi:ABC-2 type transport system ATP-binding protein|nr:ATP-binding cassette domain-containing protein [Burkholderiales bacterium]
MIKVDNLTRTFGPKTAVDKVSFQVERGEVLGFLGPNGAGKSTTMRMITGYIPPTSGRVEVCGFDVAEKPIEARRRIGYLPESAPSYHDMSVASFLGFAAEMRGFRGDEKKRAVGKAVETCFLESVLHQSIDTLSKGFRHRTCLAQALIHDPEVLILDEPTDGLDPNQKHEVRSLIKRMGANKAIIFSTHILEEVEAACSRAIIIDRGAIVANGTPDELKARSDRAGAVLMTLRGPQADAVQQAFSRLPGVARAEIVLADGAKVAVRAYPDGSPLDSAFAAHIAQQVMGRWSWTIEELHTEEGRLDDVFRAITRSDTARDAARTAEAAAA